MQHLALVLYIRTFPKHIHNYASKIIGMFHLTALLEHNYCTSNQDMQNMVEPEPHLWSCTLTVTLGNDYKIFITNCVKFLKIHPKN